MNKPIRRVAFVTMIMFALLLANGSYAAMFRTADLNANPQNRRARDAEFAQDRGVIVAGDEDKTVLANTEPADDRFKYQRTYPEGKLYAPITGYYSYDHARTALENSYNTELAGTDDALFVRRLIDLITNRTPRGASVETTILPEVQQAAAEALGKEKGAVVALDPKTGAVLGLVTSPSYDPNEIAGHDLAAADKAYKELADSKNKPLSNRAAREIYPPGSTFKLITAAAALEAGLKPDSKVASPDKLRLPNSNFDLGNDTNCGGEQITISQALEVSCNTAFANLGLQIGQDKLRTQAQKFGFNQRHLSDLGAAASQFPDEMDGAQLALSSIGQFDVAASPLQMAMVTAAIANDGILMDPYLVNTVRGPDLQPISTHRPTELGVAMSPENARLLKEMMVGVVTDGTGGNAAIEGFTVGGKTGTAQSDPKRKPFAWFTSFAEVDGKQVAVAVMVEDADIERNDISGGRLAAPIAKAVMEAALQ